LCVSSRSAPPPRYESKILGDAQREYKKDGVPLYRQRGLPGIQAYRLKRRAYTIKNEKLTF
jgi:hypothetical protein